MSDISFEGFSDDALEKLWVMFAGMAPSVPASVLYQHVDAKWRDVLDRRMRLKALQDAAKKPLINILRSYDDDLTLESYSEVYTNLDDLLDDLAEDILDELGLWPSEGDLD